MMQTSPTRQHKPCQRRTGGRRSNAGSARFIVTNPKQLNAMRKSHQSAGPLGRSGAGTAVFGLGSVPMAPGSNQPNRGNT